MTIKKLQICEKVNAMAITNDELLVKIGVDTSNASKSIDELTKELIGFRKE